ncbi:hypothetical protein JST56_02005 [Candidatus Dependentiae bacterium]|jgi:hypothetical protein|nr:hypothetical protein [Candidatus Dependentiae bacterium]
MKKLSLFLCISFLCQQIPLLSHEIFSLRADTVRQGGINVDTLLKYTKAGSQRELEYMNRLMYGVTEYLTLELRVPIFLEKKVSEAAPVGGLLSSFKTAGAGKIEFISKLRVFYDYGFQKRNQIILVGGVLFPTARRNLTGIEKKPIIDNSSLDFVLGTAAAFETIKFYHFASLVYQINTSVRHIKEGDQLFYSYAFGFRPEMPDVDKVDWVFLIDFDGIWTQRAKVNGSKLINSGSNIIFVGPSCFRSKGNAMIKAAIQVPVAQHLNGFQEKSDFRCMLGLFLQF